MNERGLYFWLSLVLASAALLHSPVLAAKVQIGDVEPDVNLWGSNTTGYVGRTTDGAVHVDGASILGSDTGYLGYYTGATGTVTVSGQGSEWSNRNWLYLGRYGGQGALTIAAGGKVSTSTGYLGYVTGSSGTALVTGARSHFNNSAWLNIGHAGSGTLTVEAGGQVINDRSRIGYVTGSTGTAAVTGTGSALLSSSELVVGYSGSGTLTVEAGGQVESMSGHLGYNSPGSMGTVTVKGVGSQWTNNGKLFVGDQGTAVLNIISGGLITVGGTLTIDADLDGDGYINMATGGMLALAGDGDESLSEFLALAGGTDAIRYWNASLGNWAPLTGTTTDDILTLEYVTEGDLAGYTLLTVGRIADIDVDGDVDGRDFLAWQRNPSLGSLADWQAHYSGAVSQAPLSVPEPASLLLVALGFAVGACGVVRRPRERFSS